MTARICIKILGMSLSLAHGATAQDHTLHPDTAATLYAYLLRIATARPCSMARPMSGSFVIDQAKEVVAHARDGRAPR
jgi:hypothetical protein